MDWLLDLPIPAMTLVILAAIYAVAAAIYLVITRLAVGERTRTFKSISPGMLPPLSVVFALLVGFLAAQVWADADRASTAVNHEASALRSVVLLANQFPAETDARFRELVRQHIQTAVGEAWPKMGQRSLTLTLVPKALAQALKLAIDLDPHSPGQSIAQRELVASIQAALDARRQRVLLSNSTVSAVKWGALLVQAGLMLLAIAMVHCDNPAANRIILGIFATGTAAAIILIAAYSRPFSGPLAVQPTALLQVMPEAGGP